MKKKESNQLKKVQAELELRKKLFTASSTLLMKENQKLKTENAESVNPKEKKKHNSISKTATGLFCGMLQESEIREKWDTSDEAYCQRVCDEFKLDYTDTVRRNMPVRPNLKSYPFDKYLAVVQNFIIPNLPDEIREKLQSYINNKTNTYKHKT